MGRPTNSSIAAAAAAAAQNQQNFVQNTPLIPPPPSVVAAAAAAANNAMYDDEDTSKGDELDALSTRNIAVCRFVRHHEWMEQILGTAYGTRNIIQPDLGFDIFSIGISPSDNTLKDIINLQNYNDKKSKKENTLKAKELLIKEINDIEKEIENMNSEREKTIHDFQIGSGAIYKRAFYELESVPDLEIDAFQAKLESEAKIKIVESPSLTEIHW